MKSKGVLTASDNDMQGRLGVHLTGLHVHSELEWIFREKPTSDIGIDGEIEIRNAKGESHGRIIAIQIKCGPSYLKERTVSGITYRGDYAHLKYWSNFAVPVVIVLCDPASSKCWWQLVDMERIAFHAKGWSIEVPHSNLLNAAAKPALELVAGRLQKKDFVELALRDWIGWRFEHKMRLASLLDSPRDYHWFSHLGAIEDQFFMIDYLLSDEKGFRQEQVDEMIEAAKYNRNSFDFQNLLLAFIVESKHHLRDIPVPPSIVGLKIEYVPLLLRFEREPALLEVGESGRLVAFYSRGIPLDEGAGNVALARRTS